MVFNESTSIFYDGDVGPILLNAASEYTDSQAEHIKNRAPHNTGHVGSSTRVMAHHGRLGEEKMTSLNNLSDRRASVEVGTMARSTYLANHRSAVRPESTNLREHGVFTPKILEAAGSINWLPPPGRRLPHSDDLRESISTRSMRYTLD